MEILTRKSIFWTICVIFASGQFNSQVSAQWCTPGSLTPNPADCSTYLQCDNGLNVVRPCPPGLHFNPSKLACDYPYNVNCFSQPVKPIPPSPGCVHGSLTPMQGNCSTYLRCENGVQTIRSCPFGQQFNPQRLICDSPYTFVCASQPQPVRPINPAPIYPVQPQPGQPQPPRPINPPIYPLPPQRQEPQPYLECYSCVHVANRGNLSSPGCDRKPGAIYKRSDCFGFGDLGVAGGVRQSHHSSGGSYGNNNVYCVTYKGYSELDGSLVILRGCENANEVITDKKKCVSSSQNDFLFPRLGWVRRVEKCYCNGNACNGGGRALGGEKTNVFLSLVGIVFSFYFIIIK